jgi:hypothetical protein
MHPIGHVLLALIALGSALLAHAEKCAEPDWDAVRTVITRQLEAFQPDDADAAFSFAAPSIREQFGTARAFMQMVREAYAAVYRPRSTAFLAPIRTQAGPVQPVEVTDQQGEIRLALYLMQRQADGTWRIAGCVRAGAHGQSV